MSKPYANYTVKIDDTDSRTRVHSGKAAGGGVARFTYRLFRIPSERRFLIRFFHDATEEDRAFVKCALHVQAALWRQAEQHARRYRRSNGTCGFAIVGGREVEDPLVQLELEMMIDLSSGVTA